MKIKSIKKEIGSFQHIDLTVEKNQNFFANGMLTHNCNLPAKNVIIVGTMRGINEVDELDILQEGGRAGRSFPPKYIIVTPEADEYEPSTLDNLSLAITSNEDDLNGRASTIVRL